jgi:endonuclease/exonuclease/phosphatase (EEP) superfamily protein YafD
MGGDFNAPAATEVYAAMTKELTDTHAQLGVAGPTLRHTPLRIDYLLTSPQWRPVSGAVIESDASDHRPITLVAQGKGAP